MKHYKNKKGSRTQRELNWYIKMLNSGGLDAYGSYAGCNPVPSGSVGSIPTIPTNKGWKGE